MSEYIYGTDGHEGHWLTGEEIVRCRDCKHCSLFDVVEDAEGDDVEILVCSRLRRPFDVNDMDFCAWGERRDA